MRVGLLDVYGSDNQQAIKVSLEQSFSNQDISAESNSCILPLDSASLHINKGHNYILLFILVAVVTLSLSNSEKWQLLLQPPVHISRKLSYILYPFHSFW